MKQKISIIIPVYNSAHYLKKCLDSVVCQTFSDLQIICVDDGSTDDSWKILSKYAKIDKRFEMFRKNNEGVSEARNYGLSKAVGEYLMFVDSDDWIDEKTCELAIDKMQKTNSDVVMWSYVRERLGKYKPKKIMDHDCIYEENDVQKALYRRMFGVIGEELTSPENADALCTVWGKLYRRNIIEENRIRFFDICKIGSYEDGLFNLDVFRFAKRVVFLNQNLYYYRRDNLSSVTSEYDNELKYKKCVLFDYLDNRIKADNLGAEYVQALNNRIVLSLIELGINETNCPGSWLRKIQEIRSIIAEERYCAAISVLDYRYFAIHWKLFFKLAEKQCALGVFVLLCVIQMVRGR